MYILLGLIINSYQVTMLTELISCFENNVDQDKLASDKPADQNLNCFHSTCKHMLLTEILQTN